jgi:tetratricopeptide (TPR) repeat protein
MSGVEISGSVGSVAGDIVGGNKGLDEEKLLDFLAARGLLQSADAAGLQRRTIIQLAQGLKRSEALTFEQAMVELGEAVKIAVDVIARGERGSNDDRFVDRVLARVAERVKANDLEGGVRTVDDAIAEEEARGRRSLATLLEEGIKLDTLRRDAVSVARRVERLAGIGQSTERPAWRPAFRARWGEYWEDGRDKGINFSLMVAIEMARLLVATALDGDERAAARNLFANALQALGEREGGTARLEEAVAAYRAALEEWTRERAPLGWATTQNNFGNALSVLGAREGGTARLEEAVAAFRAALEEWTRERVPLDWAMAQTNLGIPLFGLVVL